jgi:molecular chaperone DnaK (HSP70)
MAQPKFSIGIDLGTSNSVLAYAPLATDEPASVLAVPQLDTPTTEADAPTLPSFLYRPEDSIAAQVNDRGTHAGGWIVGRLAQRRAGEVPGRVAHSAKSWLCHHAADRTARFLPWGSDELTEQDKISPVAASAMILAHLRAAWTRRFAERGTAFAFDAQDITVTVPASFDAAAQKLTLDAARAAGFPEHVRLLEEPQAAFYWWLDRHAADDDAWRFLEGAGDAPRHVLVVDIGGGTSDFSLFALRMPDAAAAAGGAEEPEIERIAVSDHILLGGDNIDLAIAHLLATRLAAGSGLLPSRDKDLSARQWDHLVATSRSLKEHVLSTDGPPDEAFPVSIPGRGSGLLAGALSARLTRAELDALLLDGFFPECWATAKPQRAAGAVKEWGLPYASDAAVTRHLAAFLNGRPAVDAVLLNGGTMKPAHLRRRLIDQIGAWQNGHLPHELTSGDLDLAVALGAATAARRQLRGTGRIAAGSARAVFLEVHRRGGESEAGRRSLVCVLPHGAPTDTSYEVSDLDLRLRLGRPVRFQVYTSTRQDERQAGDVVSPDDDFERLPPLETVATVKRSSDASSGTTVPVALKARLNELGLLQLACRSLDPRIRDTWPLEFDLRPAPAGSGTADAPPPADGSAPDGAPSVDVTPKSLDEARAFLAVLTQPAGKKQKITAQRLLDRLEEILGRPKGDWNGILLRELWTTLEGHEAGRALSVEHEETWLILAGFLLRPGFGVTMDASRIDALWRIVRTGLRFPGKRIKLQEYILWRRVAGGLDRDRQEALLAAELDRLGEAKAAPPELIRMIGSFERIGQELKAELIADLLETVVECAAQQKHCAPCLAALGLLLNRTPFHAGPETIVPPALVENAYDVLRRLDWSDPRFDEVQALFLRAARAVDDPRLNPPRSLRESIAGRLEKCGVSAVKTGRLREVVPVQQADRLSLYGEALPPGLILGDGG